VGRTFSPGKGKIVKLRMKRTLEERRRLEGCPEPGKVVSPVDEGRDGKGTGKHKGRPGTWGVSGSGANQTEPKKG